jgi:preprotein translocase YajC subunit
MSLWIFNSIVAGLVLATGNRQRVVHHVTDYKRGKRYSYETLNIGGVWMGPDGMVGGWEFRGDNAGLPWEFLVRFVEFFHERRQKQLVRSLIKDDRVQTTAGVVGTVVDVRSDDVILMVGDARDKEIRVSKSAIRRKLKKGETVLPTWKRKRKKPKPFFRFAEDPAAQPPAPGPH